MEQLQLILQQNTTGTLTGMKKKYEIIITFLLVGIFLNVLVSPFLHFLLGEEGPAFRLTFSGLLSLITVVVMGLIVVFFYWTRYTALKTNLTPEDLKLSLSENIAGLKKSLKQEVYFIGALFVIIFIVGRMTSQYLGHGHFGNIMHPDILLALVALISIMGFYIYKRVTVYKKNIQELQTYLAELEDSTNG